MRLSWYRLRKSCPPDILHSPYSMPRPRANRYSLTAENSLGRCRIAQGMSLCHHSGKNGLAGMARMFDRLFDNSRLSKSTRQRRILPLHCLNFQDMEFFAENHLGKSTPCHMENKCLDCPQSCKNHPRRCTALWSHYRQDIRLCYGRIRLVLNIRL